MKAEEKAMELYPIEDFPFREDAESQYKLRAAFLKGYEYANQQPEVERDIKWLQERVPELKDEGKAYFVKLALQYQSEDYEETIEELRMLTATATANSITEKKQPEQGEVEELKKDANYISDYWKSKVSFRDSAEQELFELAYTIGVQSEREAEKKPKTR
jgi:hypothetical protein